MLDAAKIDFSLVVTTFFNYFLWHFQNLLYDCGAIYSQFAFSNYTLYIIDSRASFFQIIQGTQAKFVNNVPNL